jgi:hypothetical protein
LQNWYSPWIASHLIATNTGRNMVLPWALRWDNLFIGFLEERINHEYSQKLFIPWFTFTFT